MSSLKTKVFCKFRGHKKKPCNLMYLGMWTSDEVCERCGLRFWWPQ